MQTTLEIAPLSKSDVAHMPKFNNLHANGLSDFWEDLENIGNKVVIVIDATGDFIDQVNQTDINPQGNINTPLPPAPKKTAISGGSTALLWGLVLSAAGYGTYRLLNKKK